MANDATVSDVQKLEVQVELFIVAKNPDGSVFNESHFDGKTFDQSSIGLAAINRRGVKFLDSLVDLGVMAAVRKDPALAEDPSVAEVLRNNPI
jgi:hypothetical protein